MLTADHPNALWLAGMYGHDLQSDPASGQLSDEERDKHHAEHVAKYMSRMSPNLIVHTGDIAKGDAMLILSQQFCAALAKRHRLTAAHLDLAHKKYPHADEKQHGKPVQQEHHVPRRFILGLCCDLYFLRS